MAQSTETSFKKLMMDHGDDKIDKNICIPPPILQEEIKDVCENCKVYKAANETLTGENAKLRGFIKDLLVETGRSPENLNHFLASGEISKNLDKETAKNFAAQKALANSVILRKVFGYFDDPVLLQFRRVCKFWAEEASACLLIFKDPSTYQSWDKVPPAQVRLSYNSAENTLGKNGIGTLQNIVELMKSGLKAGRKFPCSHFSLTCPNLLPTVIPDAVELLEKFGPLMESLVLEFFNLPNSALTNRDIAEGLRNLLFKWAPNLKYFFFKVEPWPSDDPVSLLNDENSSSSLPNLQILGWYNRRRGELYIYEDILRISSNLKLSNYSPMNEVVQANRTDAIKEIQVRFTSDVFAATPRLFLEKEFCTTVEKIKIDYQLHRGLDQDPNVLSLPSLEAKSDTFY